MVAHYLNRTESFFNYILCHAPCKKMFSSLCIVYGVEVSPALAL